MITTRASCTFLFFNALCIVLFSAEQDGVMRLGGNHRIEGQLLINHRPIGRRDKEAVARESRTMVHENTDSFRLETKFGDRQINPKDHAQSDLTGDPFRDRRS